MADITGSGTLNGTKSNDTITGLATDDSLFGDAGNDTLDGGAGDDLLRGGRGSDIYVFAPGSGDDTIDNSGGSKSDLDTIQLSGLNPGDIRLTRNGNDLVLTLLGSGETLTVSQYFLDDDHKIDRIQFANGTLWDGSAILANLTQAATEGADVINGTPGDDILQGLGGNDTLYGYAGNDTLDGGSGADRMEGGAGNDRYIVDNAGDLVVEASNAGTDTVESSISYTLTANVENLVLTGTDNLNGTGNSLVNTLTGNAGNNLLDGGAGNDSMAGGLGDDTYVVAQNGDTVIEAASEGTDTVRAAINYTLGANVENLELTGTGNNAGTGNELDNRLTGNSGNNTLDGRAGNDWLKGGTGSDTYRYGQNYGHDVIDNSGGGRRDTDTLQLLGLNPADVRFLRSGDDLKMVVLASGETLTVEGFYLIADHEIDRVTFADGTGWNNATLKAAAANSANLPPSSTDDSVTTLEDTPAVLGVNDFGTYSDPESSPLAAVQITALPGAGSLEYHDGSDWTAVSQDQVISRADLDAGRLRYVPAPDGNGAGYASIGFRVGDGMDFALQANNLTVNVTPVDDPAVATVIALSADSGSSASDFITNVASQTVSGSYTGTLAAGASIQVSADGGDSWIDAVVDSNTQSWSASGVILIASGTSLLVRTLAADGSVTPGIERAYTLDTSADLGNDLTVTLPDALINGGERSAVAYSVSGLDADASAVVTFSDGVNSVVGSNGVADLSSLTDGPISVQVTAADVAGNSSQRNGHAITLTFDQLASGTQVASEYQSLGVTASGAQVLDASLTSIPAPSAPNIAYSPSGLMYFNLAIAEVQNVSVYLSGPVNTGLFAYDGSGNLVGQAVLSQPALNALLSVTSTGNPIARVEIHNGGATFAIDDLRFTASGLQLDTTADTGNDLAVILPDTLINNAEKAVVAYSVSGLDADASATVVFRDSADNQVLGVNGVADLTGLLDGPVSVEVTATDAAGNTASGVGSTLTLDTTAPQVSGPVTLPAGSEDVAYTISAALLLANASDANGTLSVQSVSVDPADGSLVDNGDGSWTFTPALNRNGAVSFAVVIADAAGATVATSASLSLAAVNDAPAPVNALANQTASQDQPFSYSVPADAFADVDGDALSYSASLADGSALPGWLVFDAQTRSFSGTPGNGDVGSLSVKVTASDGSLSAEASFSLAVGNSNDAPTVSGPVSLPAGTEDVAYTITAAQLLANASDVDAGDSLSVQSVSVAPADGSLVDNGDGSWTFTPALNRNGTVSFAVVIADAAGATVSTSASLSLGAVNDAPNISPETLPDLVFASSGGASFWVNDGNGQFNNSGGVLAFSSGYNYDVSVGDVNSDGYADVLISGDSSPGRLFINNGDGTFELSGYGFPAAFQNDNDFIDLDLDGDLDVSFVNYHGNTVIYRNDGFGGFSVWQSFEDPEIINLAYGDFNKDGLVDAYVGRGVGSDLVLINDGNGVLLDSGQVIPTAESYWSSVGDVDRDGDLDVVVPRYQDATRVLINDGLGNFSDSGQVIGGSQAIYTSLGDVNGDGALDIYVQGFESGARLWLNDGGGNFIEGMSFGNLGRAEFVDVDGDGDQDLGATWTGGVRIYVNDGGGNFTLAQSISTATPYALAFAPVVSIRLSSGTEDTLYTIHASELLEKFSDPDGDTLSVANLSVDPAYGALVDNNDGTWTFTPALHRSGAVSFTVVIADGAGATVATSASLSLAAVNDAPTLFNALANQTASQDQPFSYSVPANAFADVDGDALSYSAILADGSALPGWLVFDAQTRSFSGTPGNGDVGSLSVKVTASDGSLSAEASFSLTVGNSNDAPTVSGPVSLPAGTEDVAYTISAAQLLANASDVDAGDTLSVQSVSVNAADGSLVDNGDGSWTFTPSLNRNGAVSFAVVIADAAGATVATSASLSLAAVNDAPTGSVTLDGTPSVGQTLTASHDLADVDGLGAVTLYWQVSSDGSEWTDLDGVTGESYTLSAAEAGLQVRVEARYTDDGGTAEAVSSVATDAVDPFNLIEGDSGDNNLVGTAQADRILGRGGNDSLLGAEGDDELVGGAGNDDLLGGAGNDTALFAGNLDQYTLTFDPRGYLTVQAAAGSGEAGLDRVQQIEQLRFADGSLTLTGAPGGELRVNSTTASDQYLPTVTGLSDGGYVVSWMSLNQDGSGWGIYAQRYSEDGSAVGGEVRVNSTTASDQLNPTISGLSDGGYVVSWHAVNQDGSGWDIYAQRYAADGSVVGGEVRVNSTTASDQPNPTISGLNDGGYVVSWHSVNQDGSGLDIYAQRYAAAGSAAGGEVRVNSTTASDQYYPTITGLSDGGYVVSWMSWSQDGSGSGIYAQRYAADGSVVGGEVRVNSNTLNNQEQPAITGLSNGGYVVSWMSSDGNGRGIYAQRYAADGSVVGGEVRVNSTTVSDQWYPTITGLADGGYVVSWWSSDGSGWGIYAQRYAADGSTVGGEVQVNSSLLGNQDSPQITGLSDGGYVVSWTSNGQDGSGYGIYAQRYDAGGNPIANSLSLWGDEEANQVFLGAGDERIGGGGSDDLLHGGAGMDTALYQGAQRDFALDFTGPNLLMVSDQNLADGDEGNDQLQGVERLEFANGVRLAAIVAETRVNSTTLNGQEQPTVTGLSDGGYVVSWQSFNQDGSGYGIYAQRYAVTGGTVGGEVRVNTTTLNGQEQPTVNGLSDGGYVVSWQSIGDIYAQRYAADGSALGGEVRINSTTLDSQEQPTITALSDGGYVVTWMSSHQDGSGWGIYAQRYAANGSAQGGEARVNSTALDHQMYPTVTGLGDGGYVVSWQSFGQDGNGWGIYAQRYAANGSAQGVEVQVNSTTNNHQELPILAGLTGGGYVVSWTSLGQDGSSYGIYAQRYAADGSAQGGEVRVNSTTALDQYAPTITGLSDGGYVVSWQSIGDIYAQHYAADGSAMGSEVRVNSTTLDSQQSPAITALSDGGYVVSWMSQNQDGSGYGIYAQRFDAAGNAMIRLDWSGDASANIIRSTDEVDWFTGGAGADTFQFAHLPGSRPDLVTDFTPGEDLLALSSAIFDLQGQAPGDAGVLVNVTGSQSEAAGAYLVFNQSNQTLYYDADGAANGNAVALVTLSGVASLAASDVQLYS